MGRCGSTFSASQILCQAKRSERQLENSWKGLVNKTFFSQSTPDLAQALLGMVVAHDSPLGRCAGRIVEVEMYRGPDDKAAHSFGGRPTPRTRVMYGPPGYAYVYFVYGMHYCLNVVTGPIGSPEAILIRALEPLQGIEIMAQRRHIKIHEASANLCRLTNGPAKLAQALGIGIKEYGLELFNSPLQLYHDQDPLPSHVIATGPRINVSYAGEAALYPWRFWIKNHPCVSIKGRVQKTKT